MNRSGPVTPTARFNDGVSSAWLARRWYYTAASHRAYSVRQISPGDRRLLAEFAVELGESTHARDGANLARLNRVVFDRVIASESGDSSVGFAALENTAAGDRVIGVSAFAPANADEADFVVAVTSAFREEQIGKTLLSTLLRHAKRVGIPRLTSEMTWSNRAMHRLALSAGFAVGMVPSDRNLRSLILSLK